MTTPYRAGEGPSRRCPRCRSGLALRSVGDDAVEECLDCAGVFVRRGLVPRVLDALDLGGEVLASFESDQPDAAVAGPMYVPCPTCGVFMNRRLFAWGARVVVDECRVHGIWFDKAELRAVVEFAAGGGLARAAAQDAQRRREEERAARSRALTEGSGAHAVGDPEVTLLAGLLSLFR